MLFNSWEFLFVFLPITLAIFCIAGAVGRRHLAIICLSAASLFFYAWWDWHNLGLILGSMTGNYLAGHVIAAQPAGRRRRWVAGLCIAANLGVLAYFKYAGFFADNISYAVGIESTVHNIVIPLGISFFTFEQISYLVDVRQTGKAERSFASYSLFVGFFPHLISGPLIYPRDLLPQFSRLTGKFNGGAFAVGLTILAMGLGKKMLVADTLATRATPLFMAAAEGHVLTTMEGWLAALAYAGQIYFDFSGYSDMAIGLAWMFGIRLPVNFSSPYQATSIIEFWQRWHMTLSRLLRDYLYIPLGGNRKGKVRQHVNLMITMLLGGLWHGANWTFVVWGAVHGILLIVNHAWRDIKMRLGLDQREASLAVRVGAAALTFVAVASAWVLFRAPDFSTAVSILKSMYGLHGPLTPTNWHIRLPEPVMAVMAGTGWVVPSIFSSAQLGTLDPIFVLGALGIAWLAPNSQALLGEADPSLRWAGNMALPTRAWRPSLRWSVATGILLGLSILSLSQVSEFIYFNF